MRISVANRRQVPAICTFVFADIMAFSLFFALFLFARTRAVQIFDQSSRLLDVKLGMFNTLILITSSWLVVMAVDAARLADRRTTRRMLLFAMLVGAGFLGIKIFEYIDKFSHGISMLSNDFFMFYFFLTGLHLLHILVGMGVLAMLWFKAKQESLEGPFLGWVESGGVYWHMVDLLWIMLFPLLYLLGGS